MNTVTPRQLEKRPEPLPAFILPWTDQLHCTWILIGTSSKLAPGKLGRWGPVSQWKVDSGIRRWSLCQARWGMAGLVGCHPDVLRWRGSCPSPEDTSALPLESDQPERQSRICSENRVQTGSGKEVTSWLGTYWYLRTVSSVITLHLLTLLAVTSWF